VIRFRWLQGCRWCADDNVKRKSERAKRKEQRGKSKEERAKRKEQRARLKVKVWLYNPHLCPLPSVILPFGEKSEKGNEK